MTIAPVSRLRKRSHVQTRLDLRDERSYATRLLPWIASVYLLFSIVDYFSTSANFWAFFGIRLLAIVSSRFLFLVTRSRIRYGARAFWTIAPYMWAVEFIMFRHGLAITPYFAGMALVLFSAATLFPMHWKVAGVVYFLTCVPALIHVALFPFRDVIHTVTFGLMTGGSIMLCAINANQVYRDFIQRLIATETLARDLGKRDREVRQKTEELLKRRTFESQFSPQVVSAVLHDPAAMLGMHKDTIATIVIDIENSTTKANTIPVDSYREVIEEVFDVFASACLKWNVTVDKFTGDGAQAIVGAPVPARDSIVRALNACKETMAMLMSRKDHLSLLWRDPLNVRFAICEGPALVGFFGRGTLKSFTAIGDTVSFTHRLCATPRPWTVAIYSFVRELRTNQHWFSDWTIEHRSVTGLKGFKDQRFEVIYCEPEIQDDAQVDIGRCPDCATPLVMIDGANGLPRAVCPGCSSRQLAA